MKNQKAELALLISMAGLYFFSYFQRVAIPSSIFNEIQSGFGVSASAVTALSSIYLYIYAGMQLFIGLLVDRYGASKIILIFGAVLSLGSLIFPLSHSISTLYLSRALTGLGASAMYLCAVKETDRLFDTKNFAPVLGILCIIGYSGGLAGTSPFRKMVEQFGWRGSLLVIGTAGLVTLGIAFWTWRIARPKHKRSSNLSVLGNIGAVMKNKHNYPVFIALPLVFAVYFVIQATIGAKLLQDIKGVSALASTKYTFAMMLVTMTMLLLSGVISKMIGNRRKPFLVGSCILNIVALIIMSIGSVAACPPWVFLVSFIMMALAAGCTTVVVAGLKELNHPDTAVLSIGVQNTISYIFVAVLANSCGWILDIFRSSATVSADKVIYPVNAYLTLFAVLGIFSIIALAFSFYLKETRGKVIAGVALNT